jgi:uncharacterized damage-inducible protein DinB
MKTLFATLLLVLSFSAFAQHQAANAPNSAATPAVHPISIHLTTTEEIWIGVAVLALVLFGEWEHEKKKKKKKR